MGKTKRIRKHSTAKRLISPRDHRIKASAAKAEEKTNNDSKEKLIVAPKIPSALFFRYNTQLGPPFRILVDTNFINFSIQNKLDFFDSMTGCLLAKCIPMVTDCVLGELEKLGDQYRLALRIAHDSRFERLSCQHKGTYADDCIVQRVTQHKCYIVATCDRDLKRRLRKIPGVPIMYIHGHRFSIERFPDVNNAPKF